MRHIRQVKLGILDNQPTIDQITASVVGNVAVAEYEFDAVDKSSSPDPYRDHLFIKAKD